MSYRELDIPRRGVNRRQPATDLHGSGFWRTIINVDLFNGQIRRRRGSTQLHTPGSGGVPSGCTVWDFLESHEQEIDQDKMLLILEDSGGATELWTKRDVHDGQGYSVFTQRTWVGTEETWSDDLLGTDFPYPRILKAPNSYRIIPVDADEDALILFYKHCCDPEKRFHYSQSPSAFPNVSHVFAEAKLLEPREIDTSLIRLNVEHGDHDTNIGNLGKNTRYIYGYTLVYEDGQQGLPWYRDARESIPGDLRAAASTIAADDDWAIQLELRVADYSNTAPTNWPLRVIGVNVYRAKIESYGVADAVQSLGDFHLLAHVSFDPTDAIFNYSVAEDDNGADYSFSGVTPSSQSGDMKRFDVGKNLTTGSSARWKGATSNLSPVNCALRITAVSGDSGDSLVGQLFNIDAFGTPDDQSIDVYDPNNYLDTGKTHSGEIVENICSYADDGKYYASVMDDLSDISSNPEMWSHIGVTPGEYLIRASGKYGSIFEGRMALANCYIDGEHYPSMGVLSVEGAIDTFPTRGQFDFNWDGGEPLEGPLVFTGTGLLAFKERSVAFVHVDYEAEEIVLSTSEVLWEDGLASVPSIVEAGGLFMWAGYEGIWAFSESDGFLKLSDGEYSRSEESVGGVQEIYDLMADGDKEISAGYYDSDGRKMGICIPIVNGSVTWDDILSPLVAPDSLDDSYVCFEYDFKNHGWFLADKPIRKSRKGINGELYSTDFTDIDQWEADYGSEQESNIRAVLESPWFGGAVTKLTQARFSYEDGPFIVTPCHGHGHKGRERTLPDSMGFHKQLQVRLGVGGNPTYLLIETEHETTIKTLEIAGRTLEKVMNR